MSLLLSKPPSASTTALARYDLRPSAVSAVTPLTAPFSMISPVTFAPRMLSPPSSLVRCSRRSMRRSAPSPSHSIVVLLWNPRGGRTWSFQPSVGSIGTNVVPKLWSHWIERAALSASARPTERSTKLPVASSMTSHELVRDGRDAAEPDMKDAPIGARGAMVTRHGRSFEHERSVSELERSVGGRESRRARRPRRSNPIPRPSRDPLHQLPAGGVGRYLNLCKR